MNPNTSSTDRQTAASADIQTASSSPAAEIQTASSRAPAHEVQTAPPKKRRMLSSAFSEYFESLRDGGNLFLLWAFLIPAGLLLLFYVSRAVFPIGEGSVLILDLNGQYVSFFEELRNKLLGGGSLLYGIDRMIEDSTHIRTMIVDDPLACAAHGAGKLLTKLDSMQDGMMNFLRNREMRN